MIVQAIVHILFIVVERVAYLKKFGYSGEQAYAILSTAPVEGRVLSSQHASDWSGREGTPPDPCGSAPHRRGVGGRAAEIG